MFLYHLLLWLLKLPDNPFSIPYSHTEVQEVIRATLILSSLDKATVYLEKNLKYLKQDDIVSIRMLQAELKGFEEAWAENSLGLLLLPDSRKIYRRLEAIVNTATVYLDLTDNTSRQELYLIIMSGFWKLPQAWTLTNDSMSDNTLRMYLGSLKDYDSRGECTESLLGTGRNGGRPCEYSEFCEYVMTMPGSSEDDLSHQLLYFLISKMLGCSNGMFHKTQDIMDRFCATKKEENKKIAAFRYPDSHRKVFMKNIMLCGLGGFLEFYEFQSLEEIFKWQTNPEGCFSSINDCSVSDTSAAAGALGGFLYVLAKYSKEFQDAI